MTALGFEGGPFSEKVCLAIRDTGVMPPSEVMSGQIEAAGDSWPREVLQLASCGADYKPWQAFAAWVLLVWVADTADDYAIVAEDETIYALTSAVTSISPLHCASAIAFLRWQAPARNDPGPTVYHELGIACLYAAMFRAQPGQRLRDVLDEQCQRLFEVADQETLKAIDTRDIYNVGWPLDLSQSLSERGWRVLCEATLGPFEARAMPASAGEVLRRMRAGA